MGESTSDLFGDRGACLSSCGRYRYALWRHWDRTHPTVLFVMLNPSTADAEADDPTIRRCIGFARQWGFGGIHVCNLYGLRATKPRELCDVENPVDTGGRGPRDNDRAIMEAMESAGRIVAAWGAWPGPLPRRAARVMDIFYGRQVLALGLTRDGHPRHPLYVRGGAEPVVYSLESAVA